MNTPRFRLLFVGLFFLWSSAALIAQIKAKQAAASKTVVPASSVPKSGPKPTTAPVRSIAREEEDDRKAQEEWKLEQKRKQEAEAVRIEKVYQSIEQEMVLVKGGTFQMGDASGESDEKPVHSVTVSDFYLGKNEVTQAQWQAVMGTNSLYFTPCDQCSVRQVSWDDAQEFIKKLNTKTGKTYRLPTEAEWEYAARGGGKQTYTYAGSNTIDEVAWYSSNARSTHPVREKKANELGLYDMSGNVFEWCQDWYGPYPSSATIDPKGPDTGSVRVCRGGSWFNDPALLRVAYRERGALSFRGNVGFRLARQQ